MKKPSLSAIASASLAAPISLILPAGGVPDVLDYQFMPPGTHRIVPSVTDKNGSAPQELSITVSAKYADVFQRAHETLLAQAKAGQGDKPFTDFNHEDGAASSHPQRFYWGGEDPKTGGVRCEAKLTGSGKAALVNGDYSRFSPRWIFGKKSGEPLGLPINMGGLVNRAAFQTIAPILSAGDADHAWAMGIAADAACPTCGKAACTCTDDDGGTADALGQAAHKASSKAAVADEGNAFNAHTDAFQAHIKAAAAHKAAGQPDEAKIHNKLADYHKKKAEEIAAKNLTAPSAEAAAKQNQTTEPMTQEEIGVISAKAAEAAVKALEPVITGLKAEITSLKKTGEEAVRASARSAVMVHVTRGAIAPEGKLPDGTLLVDHWTNQYIASASNAEALLGTLPGKAPARRIISMPANGGTSAALSAVNPEERIMASAKEARKTAPDRFKTDAAALEAHLRTPAGQEEYQHFRSDIVTGAAKDRLTQLKLN